MKNLTTKILAISFLTFIACKNEGKNQDADANQNPMNNEITKTNNYKETGNFENDEYSLEKETDSVNENWNLDSPERKQRLYSRFNMTDDQINRYEKSLKDWRSGAEENAYKSMSVNERSETENTILKGILDENQYQQYKTWLDNQLQR